jgi:hypothetical protein
MSLMGVAFLPVVRFSSTAITFNRYIRSLLKTSSKLYENWRDIASGRTTQKTPLPTVFPLLRGVAA